MSPFLSRLTILIAVVALAGVAALTSIDNVRADVTNVTTTSPFNSGSSVIVNVTLTAGTADITISASGGGAILTLTDCDNPECPSDVGKTGATVIANTDNLTDIELSLTATCATTTTITIVAIQGSSVDTVQTTCLASSITVINNADGATSANSFNYDITGSGCGTNTFDLVGDNSSRGLTCTAGVYNIDLDTLPTGWVFASIACTKPTGSGATFNISSDAVQITLDSDDTITCTFNINSTGGTAATLTVSATPASLNCSGVGFISITAKNASGGNVANGTVITVATSGGSLGATQVTTTDGSALSVLTAPATAGIVTVTATSGTVTGSVSVPVTCATPVPAATATTAPAPPAVIAPPSTGDAGLSTDTGSLGIWMIAILAGLAALLIAAYRRARI